ncbi:MAG: prepilin peptidase [Rickettsiales bacterium]|nr:prepilin peptidase [Rickettsiales bacterium]
MIALIVIIFGLVFGSFITMASHRLPRDEEMVRTPSHCPNCSTALTFQDLWPLFSWILSKGKCRHCEVKISARYPLTEIVTAATFYLIYATHGITPLAVVLMLMSVALLIMIVVDLEHFIIPDEIHFFLLPLGLVYHYVSGSDWLEVAISFALGGGLGLLLHYGYKWVRKKDGLGFGDVKFLAVAGLWLTLPLFPAFLFLSGVLGVATGLLWRVLGRGPIFPFGPALAMSLFLCAAYPDQFNILENINLISN